MYVFHTHFIISGTTNMPDDSDHRVTEVQESQYEIQQSPQTHTQYSSHGDKDVSQQQQRGRTKKHIRKKHRNGVEASKIFNNNNNIVITIFY